MRDHVGTRNYVGTRNHVGMENLYHVGKKKIGMKGHLIEIGASLAAALVDFCVSERFDVSIAMILGKQLLLAQGART